MVSQGLSAFTQGFLQGFGKAGGTQKLSSWAGQNIAGGEYYDPQRDPLYQQELQQARELGTPEARQQIIQEYGDFVDTGEQTPEQYFFQPAEGTPQHTAREMNQYNLEQKKLITEAMPEQLQQQIDKGEMTLAQAAQTLAQQKVKTRWMPKQYELQFDRNIIGRDLAAEELARSEIQTEYTEPLMELDVARQTLGLESDRFQLDRSQKLFPIEKETAQTQLERQQFQLGQAQTMAPYEEDLAELNVQQQQANLNRIKTENEHLGQQLQQQLRSGELQNIGAEINNRIRELQAEKGEMLLPYEIEQVKNNILTQELQNRGLELDVGYQEATQQDRIKQEQIRADTAAENLEQIRTNNEYMRRTLEDRVNSVELQRINEEINVAMAREQLERQRQLTPLEIEQVKNQIYSQELQNKAQEIQNQYQPQLYKAELQQVQRALEGDDQQTGFVPDIEDIYDTDAQGKPIYINEEGFEYQVDTDGNVLPYIDTAGTQNQQQGNSWSAFWPSWMYGGSGGWFGQEGQEEQPQAGQQTTQQPSMTINEAVTNFKQNNPDLSAREIAKQLKENVDPETFEQQTGLPLNSVIGRLRMER